MEKLDDNVCGGRKVRRLCDLQILNIQHVDEAFEGIGNLVDFGGGQPVEAVNDLLLYGGRGIFSQYSSAPGQFYGDDPAILRNPKPLHQVLFFRENINGDIFG